MDSKQQPIHANTLEHTNIADPRQNRYATKAQRDALRKRKRQRKRLFIIIFVLVLLISACGAVLCYYHFKLPGVQIKAENLASGIKLSWEAVEDAENYEIFKQSGGQWQQIKTTPKTVYADKKTKNGVKYSYRIKAIAEKRSSLFSMVSITRIAPIEISKTEVSDKAVTIIWENVDSARSYEVYRRTKGEKEQKLIASPAAGESSFTDNDIENDSVYFYALIQKTDDGDSPMPEETAVSTVKTKLDSAEVKNSPSGIKVTWKGNVDGALKYSILRKVAGEKKWTSAGTVGSGENSFIDKKGVYGKNAQYKVIPLFENDAAGKETKAGSVWGVDPKKKLVALTYDDGPYSPVTNSILDTMKKNNAHCTFFVVGDRVETYNACVTRASKQGCEVASHTYNHKYLTKLTQDEIQVQFDKAKKVIEKYSGTQCTLLRPPGGYAVASDEYPMIMWSVDTQDWSNRNADITLARAKAGIYDGSIVLMHDLYRSSAAATETLVTYLIANGYQLVTVSELMDARGISMKPGVKYYSAKK